MNTPTITVAGHFGDKQVTEVEFVAQWTDHIKQLRRLDWSTHWQKRVDAISSEVHKTATAEFQRLWLAQND